MLLSKLNLYTSTHLERVNVYEHISVLTLYKQCTHGVLEKERT
jgi:hypothetical protein